MRNRIKSLAQDAVVVGVSLVVITALAYENFLRRRRNIPYRRPIDF